MSIPTFTAAVSSVLGDDLRALHSASLRLDKLTFINETSQKENIQYKQLDIVCKLANNAALRHNRQEMADGFILTSGGRLLVNHSGGLIENAGLCLHRFFNEPLIPGSALKGIALREALRQYREGLLTSDVLKRLFGYPTNIEEFDAVICPDKRLRPEFVSSGNIAFLPAVPADSAWKLVVDVQTPHGGNDYTNPVPSFFLAVEKGARFRFTVRKTSRASEEDRKLAEELLRSALFEHGVGAKTAAGYGWFVSDAAMEEALPLTLVTPGFFGGADLENGTDTDLRIPSLRGMLRWWWRVLYRNYLDESLLQELQNVIWGDTSKSSLIVLRLKNLQKVVRKFNYKDGFKIRRDFAVAHKIPLDSSGLHYLAYGMDEKSGGQFRQRFYVEPNAQWQLFVSLKENRREWKINIGKRECVISAQDVKNQLLVALSMLCQFGGVGSKSRNGFGSLQWKGAWDEKKCLEIARTFCEKCRLPAQQQVRDYTLDPSNIVDIESLPADAWTALAKLGDAVQKFAQKKKHKEEKAVLGLPRKIHGPNQFPTPRQKGHWHQSPENLLPDLEAARNGRQTRFASPAWLHFSRMNNGKLQLTITVFPSGMIRNRGLSEEVLNDYMDSIYQELTEN